ncbi:MAG: MBL fold metallo-hydrolase [Candidatus Nealsonbacteria bacterium]|nr:MBL fold metallo-hydrolase [Candidatus Nealsonbacteria bacterium]
MNIIWHGQSCFQIVSSQSKNGQVNIVIDPFDESIGLRAPKLEADILLTTRKDHDQSGAKNIVGSPFVIDGPGEYETKEIFIQGISTPSSDKEKIFNTIYTIEAEEIKICHLGFFNQKELTDEQVEKIGETDILMIPVGGNDVISAKEAIKIMSQIEPKITIPMYYQIPKLKAKFDGVDSFLKAMGVKKVESLPKLSIKKKNISSEEAKIIILNP